MKKEEQKKVETKKIEPKKEEPKKEEVKKEEACPDKACKSLKDAWKKGIKGCYNKDSKWCKVCGTDFPKIAKMCQENTKVIEEKKAETKVKKTRTPKIKGETTVLGHGSLTQAGRIDLALKSEEGLKIKKLAALWVKEGISDDEKKSERRIQNHIAHLKTEGVTITLKDGVYRVK